MVSAMSRQLVAHEAVARRWSQPWADVVILERLARGGGTARWFLVRSPADVTAVYDQLAAGSRVSFYFDAGPEVGWDDDGTRQRMCDEITATGEIVLGYPSDGDVVVEMDILSGPGELTEYLMHRGEGARVVWGVWPHPVDDGRNGVTVDLVDADGLLRQHPH